jgi:hypothetical protein
LKVSNFTISAGVLALAFISTLTIGIFVAPLAVVFNRPDRLMASQISAQGKKAARAGFPTGFSAIRLAYHLSASCARLNLSGSARAIEANRLL